MHNDLLCLNFAEVIRDLRIISPEYFWEIWHYLSLDSVHYDSKL